MKYLVTGGTGFLGRHVAWRLATGGAEVAFTGRREAAAREVLDHAPARLRWFPIEHGSPDAACTLSRAARGAAAIVHCAALSSPWGRREAFERANVVATHEVLAACRKEAIPRLIHISTPSLYFEYRDRLLVREDEPLPPPVNEYARTKALAEALVLAAKLPETVILRPRAIFGPWDRTLMPRLLRVMKAGPVPIMRGGRALLDLTYVDNAVDAVMLALNRPLARAAACYNVSNGEPVAVADLLRHVAEMFGLTLRTRRLPWPVVAALAWTMEGAAHLRAGSEPRLTRYSAGVLAFSQTLSLAAIRDDLGYAPRIPIDEGLRRVAQWWRASPKEQAA